MTAVIPRTKRRSVQWRSAPFILIAAAVGAFVGLAVARNDARGLTLLVIAIVGAILAPHRRWLAALAIVLMFISPVLIPPLAEMNGITIRIIDVVALLLAGHTLARVFLRAEQPSLTASARRIFGVSSILLLYVGMTLIMPMMRMPDHFPSAAISYARLVSSFAMGIVIYLLLNHSEDFVWLRRVIIAAAFMNGLVAIFQWMRFGAEFLFHPSLRVDGLLGPDGLGFVGSMLLVLSLSARPYTAARRQRWAEKVGVSLGLFMLIVAKSASAIVAAGVGVALFLFLTRSPRLTSRHLITSILILAGGLAAVIALRWPDLVGLLQLSGGSFAHRVVVGYAAWLIFLRHPLFGVGWQTSWAPNVIASPDISAQVRLHLGRLPPVLLPEENPTSVHNFYLQLLAELGVVGAMLFAVMVTLLVRECLALLRSSSPMTRAVAVQWTVILVMLGIWLNTNPLFGGQMEAYLLFLAFAVIAAAPRLAGSGRPSKNGPASVRSNHT